MEAAAKQRDGRTVRAERTRQALVDALLALLDAGELSPTAAAIAQRARLYELIGGVRRAALLIEHESPAVAGWLTTARRAKADEAERVFRRELEAIPADERGPVRAALIVVCAWPAWESWRTHQRLGVSRARAAMAAAIGALLGAQR